MSSHRDAGDACDLSALYSLGALEGDDLWDYREHLADDCEACAADLDGFELVARELAFAAEPASPSPILRDRLVDRIADVCESTELESSPFRRDDEDWREHPSPGIRYRIVDVDEEARQFLAVVSAGSGTIYRSHRHAGVEEMFMLEGELRFGNRVYRAGDYVRSEAGTEHETSETREGCCFLLRASLDDGLLT